MFDQYRIKGALTVPLHQQSSGKMMGGQSHSRANSFAGANECKNVNYPQCVKCEQRHPGNCSVSLGQCYVYRGEGHKWRNCQYLGQGCHYYSERGHHKECPNRTAKQVQNYRKPSQSYQQSVTMNRPMRFSQ